MHHTLTFARSIALLGIALALAGCASGPEPKQQAQQQLDPNCTSTRPELFVYGDKVLVRQVCNEWTFGPNREQQKNFKLRKGAGL